MFYKQFISISKTLNEELISNYDYWLATLPKKNQVGITVSLIASRFEIDATIAEILVEFCVKNGIFAEEYLIRCGNEECEMPLEHIKLEEIPIKVDSVMFCNRCEVEFRISLDNIYKIYRLIKMPDASKDEIKKEILKRIGAESKGPIENFSYADSLAKDKFKVYEAYYNPDESAYDELNKLYDSLDNDYGKNTTEKGLVLEKLALKIVEEIKTVTGTNKIKSFTNQFDCIVKQPFTSSYPTLMNLMTPYFIIECKNEASSPSNTYFHKISSIIDGNDSKLGIVFSRKAAGKPALRIARDKYLLNLKGVKPQYLISLSDYELELIVKNKENFLKVLDFKLMELSLETRNADYQWFIETKGNNIERESKSENNQLDKVTDVSKI